MTEMEPDAYDRHYIEVGDPKLGRPAWFVATDVVGLAESAGLGLIPKSDHPLIARALDSAVEHAGFVGRKQWTEKQRSERYNAIERAATSLLQDLGYDIDQRADVSRGPMLSGEHDQLVNDYLRGSRSPGVAHTAAERPPDWLYAIRDTAKGASKVVSPIGKAGRGKSGLDALFTDLAGIFVACFGQLPERTSLPARYEPGPSVLWVTAVLSAVISRQKFHGDEWSSRLVQAAVGAQGQSTIAKNFGNGCRAWMKRSVAERWPLLIWQLISEDGTSSLQARIPEWLENTEL